MSDKFTLRQMRKEDLRIFFEHQLDPEANYMAAFTAKDPKDRAAFMARWTKILADEAVIKKTILVDGEIVGHIASFDRDGQREVTYWIGKRYWGRGFATRALSRLLEESRTGPIYARSAKDNIASLRVLKKCGFKIVSEGRGFANARNKEIAEVVLIADPVRLRKRLESPEHKKARGAKKLTHRNHRSP